MRHGLAVIAVRLAVQLVEHVCHCNYASVGVAQKNTGYERGVQLIMGKTVAVTRLLSDTGAESKTGWPIWQRAAGGGGDEGWIVQRR